MRKATWAAEIIERCEDARKLLGKNKSQFSAAIGMKPQTYNNFIGAQGSKPNVELVRGIVLAYGVNPRWLLLGDGPQFAEGMPAATGTVPAPQGPSVMERLAAVEADVAVLRGVFGSHWAIVRAQHEAAEAAKPARAAGLAPRANGGAA